MFGPFVLFRKFCEREISCRAALYTMEEREVCDAHFFLAVVEARGNRSALLQWPVNPSRLDATHGGSGRERQKREHSIQMARVQALLGHLDVYSSARLALICLSCNHLCALSGSVREQPRYAKHGVPGQCLTSWRTSSSSNVQQLGEVKLAVDTTRRLDKVAHPDDCPRVQCPFQTPPLLHLRGQF